jgi:tryptophan-rich sensory protein
MTVANTAQSKGCRDLAMLAVFAGGCLVAGSIVGSITSTSVETWILTIQLPGFQPPNIAFPIAWTILYLLMGTAAWLVWRRFGFNGARAALTLFFVQLALNLSWTPVFFGAQEIFGGLVLIVVIWIAVLATTVAFWRRYALAGILLLPYLAWVTFATVLNYSIWQLNA